jgi:hypothetical protein
VSTIDYESFIAKLKGDQPAATQRSDQQQVLPTEANDLTENSQGVTGDKNVLATKLERVTEKAIDRTDAILSLPLPDPDDPNFGAVLRSQNAAANTILTTQTKVDENMLRRQQIDTLPTLIREIAEYRRKRRERGEEE